MLVMVRFGTVHQAVAPGFKSANASPYVVALVCVKTAEIRVPFGSICNPAGALSSGREGRGTLTQLLPLLCEKRTVSAGSVVPLPISSTAEALRATN